MRSIMVWMSQCWAYRLFLWTSRVYYVLFLRDPRIAFVSRTNWCCPSRDGHRKCVQKWHCPSSTSPNLCKTPTIKTNRPRVPFPAATTSRKPSPSSQQCKQCRNTSMSDAIWAFESENTRCDMNGGVSRGLLASFCAHSGDLGTVEWHWLEPWRERRKWSHLTDRPCYYCYFGSLVMRHGLRDLWGFETTLYRSRFRSNARSDPERGASLTAGGRAWGPSSSSAPTPTKQTNQKIIKQATKQ